jgi:hypothetical protein
VIPVSNACFSAAVACVLLSRGLWRLPLRRIRSGEEVRCPRGSGDADVCAGETRPGQEGANTTSLIHWGRTTIFMADKAAVRTGFVGRDRLDFFLGGVLRPSRCFYLRS